MIDDDTRPQQAPHFRVLARRYRPTTFDQVIGQDALVRTLTNALRSGRIAHAYMLAGVRGVGKTTTARLIARALNCVGEDGQGGPTPEPCGVCPHCRAIAEDRHVDVLEMDAASRTGVDDIRDLIDGVRYRPTSARYKVYIVDEVHMLSKSAFNALLKTLEEPPEHVRFVFATTEIRRVPVTVLSRCQRFDLRRVDAATLARHLAAIVAREGVEVSAPALQIIARAADGSVRDGLSLLDQAIAHAAGPVDEAMVREMLGLADRTVLFDLFDAVMGGDSPTALELVAAQHAAGADPAIVIEDLLNLTHWLTRIKVVPETAEAPGVPEAERVRGRALADRLPMGELARAWQMLLKGLAETRTAPAPLEAAEMVLIRLAYAARLPTPAEALAGLKDGVAAPREPASSAAAPVAAASSPAETIPPAPRPGPSGPTAALAQPRPAVQPVEEPAGMPSPSSFRDVVALVGRHQQPDLYGHLMGGVHLVRFESGRIELSLADHVPSDLPQRLSRFLSTVTARRWLVTVSRAAGATTLVEEDRATDVRRKAEAARHPLVRAILETFPGAVIEDVRERPLATEAADAAAADADDADEA